MSTPTNATQAKPEDVIRDALLSQHRTIDVLLTALIELVPAFRPSTSPMWQRIVGAAQAKDAALALLPEGCVIVPAEQAWVLHTGVVCGVTVDQWRRLCDAKDATVIHDPGPDDVLFYTDTKRATELLLAASAPQPDPTSAKGET